MIQQMLERGKLNSGEEQDYASGLVIGKYRGLPTVGHGGADAGYRSGMERFPEQHFAAAILCNSAEVSPQSLLHQVEDVVLADRFKEPASAPEKKSARPGTITMTAEQMKTVAGTYWKRDNDDYQRILLKDGVLLSDFGGDEYHQMKPFAESHFHIEEVAWSERLDLHFVGGSGDKPARIEQSWDGGTPDVYELVAAVNPSPEQLREYAGEYVSDEVDPVYRLTVEGEKLTLLRLKQKPDSLQPATQDVFTGRLGTLRFTRDSSHRVSGFVLDAGRIQGFRFKPLGASQGSYN